jgi:hypothetical protein
MGYPWQTGEEASAKKLAGSGIMRIVGTGSANAYLGDFDLGGNDGDEPAALVDGTCVLLEANFSNTDTSTFNLTLGSTTYGAKTIKKLVSGALVALAANDFLSGRKYLITWDTDADAWIVIAGLSDNSAKAVQQQTPCYAASVTGNDTLVVTLDPVPAAYTAGMPLRVKPDARNTGPASVNVNSLGAKSIKKHGGTVDLDDGDFVAGQILEMIYDATLGVFHLTSLPANVMPARMPLSAGQSITANNAVAVGIAGTTLNTITIATTSNTNAPVGRSDSQEKRAQKIVGDGNDYDRIVLNCSNNAGSPSDNYTVGIQADSAGAPSGTFLASFTQPGTSFVNGDNTLILNQAINLANGTTYWFVIERAGALSTSHYVDINATSTNPYASGNMWTRTQSTGTWAENAGTDIRMLVQLVTVAGKAYKADSDVANLTNNFCGFAVASAAGGADVIVQFGSVLDGFSGLTIGSTYYVNATPGSIGTSAGSNSKKVGIAITTTRLLILPTI